MTLHIGMRNFIRSAFAWSTFIYLFKKDLSGEKNKQTMNQTDIYRCNSSPQKTNRVVFSPFVYFLF